MLVWGGLAKAPIQLCSDPTAGFAFYQQGHPGHGSLLARPFHSEEADESVKGDLPTVHPSLESSGRLFTHIMEQTKLLFT